MNLHNCRIKRVYLKTNYNQFKVEIYGNNSNFIRFNRSGINRQNETSKG